MNLAPDNPKPWRFERVLNIGLQASETCIELVKPGMNQVPNSVAEFFVLAHIRSGPGLRLNNPKNILRSIEMDGIKSIVVAAVDHSIRCLRSGDIREFFDCKCRQ